MIEFAGYTFPDHKACLICEHVFQGSAELAIVVHDTDGWIQCLCGAPGHDPECSKTVSLEMIAGRLPDATKLPVLEQGYFAEKLPDGTWKTAPI